MRRLREGLAGGQPRGIDVTTPSTARMYDYYLGGKDNYEADREAAQAALSAAPDIGVLARANRAFLARAVRFLTREAGIRQFIDLGTGLPTQSSLHEVTHQEAPDAQVVYVDNDPVVLTHARALLENHNTNVTVVDADMRQPHALLADPQLRAKINFDQPGAVLALLMLHFVTDAEDPAAITRAFHAALPEGSYLVISHATDERQSTAARDAAQAYDEATSTVTLRSRERIHQLLDGFELLDPGLVYLPEWRPDPDTDPEATWGVLAGVARKPE